MIITIFLGWPRKNGLGPKNSVYGRKKGHFGQSRPRNGLPSGQKTIYRKIEGIQSYLRIWGNYDFIELGPFEPKNGGFHLFSLKMQNFGLKMQFFGPKSLFFGYGPIFFPYNDWTPNSTTRARQALGRLPGPIFCLKVCIFYGTPMKPPLFWLGWTRLNGIISLPCPEVTLDNFGFR